MMTDREKREMELLRVEVAKLRHARHATRFWEEFGKNVALIAAWSHPSRWPHEFHVAFKYAAADMPTVAEKVWETVNKND